MKLKIKITLSCFILICLGCKAYLAERMVKAPNILNKPSREIIDKLNDLCMWQVDSEFFVDVGPPFASLSVWMIEPRSNWCVDQGRAWYSILNDARKDQYPHAPQPDYYLWDKDPCDYGKRGFSFAGGYNTTPDQDCYPVQARGTVIFIHGLMLDKRLWALTWGQVMSAYGYRSLMIDLRGHGLSTGDYITFGQIESRDISQMIDFFEQKGFIQGDLILFGVSYGAGIAIQTALLDSRVSRVIALEPYTSLSEAVPHFIHQTAAYLNIIYNENDYREIIELAAQNAGFDVEKVSNIAAIKKLKTPVLIIHGSEDEHVPCTHSRKLHKSAPNSQLHIIEGEDHLSLLTSQVYLLKNIILNWLNKEYN